jgi:dolichol-phosphate mannosyltransferase
MKKLVSYVLPIYNEIGNINHLYSTLDKLFTLNNNYIYEIIFVNDGSTDNSLGELIKIQQKDKRVNVINFSRNFGHQIAVTAGLDYSKGDAVIIMDSDMQDPPKVSFDLLKKWEDGYEVVYAQRKSRQDTIFKKVTAKCFYFTLRKLAAIEIPRDTGDFRLLDRRVVNELYKFREKDRFLRGLVSYVGFKQTGVLFDRDKRYAGTTSYPLRKMLRFASDGIMGFSTVPLQLITRTGFLISFVSFLGILYALFMKLLRPQVTVPGWTLLIIAVLFIGGIQIIMLGVLGGYIGRIYSESQRRPLYIISAIFSRTINDNKK